MLEIASQMILCLLLAALIGAIIGYILGKSTCDDGDCGHNTTNASKTEMQGIANTKASANVSKSSRKNSSSLAETSSSKTASSKSKGLSSSKAKKVTKSTDDASAKASESSKKSSKEADVATISTPMTLSAPREGGKDNLTRIKGIGLKIDEALNGIGIYHFDQIAAWEEENIAWADSNLGFPGRAKRENWVAQAKALAAGKETEFSQRVDKGQVSSSKKK
jgi:predicted flap endonuclease-1-like 5' DNA nuclease